MMKGKNKKINLKKTYKKLKKKHIKEFVTF